MFNIISISVDGSYCPSGWTYYDYRCFKLYDTGKQFHEAQTYCRQQATGADVAMSRPSSVNVSKMQFMFVIYIL